MARLVSGDFGEERPETKMSQEFEDRYEPIAKARLIGNEKRDPADPLYPRFLTFLKKHREDPRLNSSYSNLPSIPVYAAPSSFPTNVEI